MTPRARKLGLWILSLVVVLGVHAALFLWALYWRAAELPKPPEAEAVMIQLEPLPVAAPPPPPTPPEPVVVPEPEPEPEKIIEAPKPKLVLDKPKPKPRPKPPEPRPEPPKPVEPTPSAPPAPPAPQPPAQSVPAAPQATASQQNSDAEAKWKAQLMVRMARFKEYPDDARRRNVQGTVKLRFKVDAHGRVSDTELVQSSGNRSLDRAALRQVRRAQPLPKPPAELLHNGYKEVIAPFTYELNRGR